MAKFYGAIGFACSTEVKPGVFKDVIEERKYYCELTRNSRRAQSSDNLNDNLVISNEISIVADPYTNQNFLSMRYVEFQGVKWKISSVEVQYPRLILSIGEVYNGSN